MLYVYNLFTFQQSVEVFPSKQFNNVRVSANSIIFQHICILWFLFNIFQDMAISSFFWKKRRTGTLHAIQRQQLTQITCPFWNWRLIGQKLTLSITHQIFSMFRQLKDIIKSEDNFTKDEGNQTFFIVPVSNSFPQGIG